MQFTDEAGMVEAAGGKVWIVEGSSDNIKITTPEDLELAEAILKRKKKKKVTVIARPRNDG